MGCNDLPFHHVTVEVSHQRPRNGKVFGHGCNFSKDFGIGAGTQFLSRAQVEANDRHFKTLSLSLCLKH